MREIQGYFKLREPPPSWPPSMREALRGHTLPFSRRARQIFFAPVEPIVEALKKKAKEQVNGSTAEKDSLAWLKEKGYDIPGGNLLLLSDYVELVDAQHAQ